MRRAYFGVAAIALVGAVGARTHSPAATYTTLDQQAEPLKSAFNADAGKVRVLMLVAPT